MSAIKPGTTARARQVSRREPFISRTHLVVGAITTAWLIFEASALQALGFAAYFVGWSFGVGMVQPEPWPDVRSAYGAVAALYVICVFAGLFADKISGSLVARVGRELFAFVAFVLCLIGPPLIGYADAAFSTTFLTAQLPTEARKTKDAYASRGIIISYGGSGDPRYTVLPLNSRTHVVDGNTLWFVDRSVALVQATQTGHLTPKYR